MFVQPGWMPVAIGAMVGFNLISSFVVLYFMQIVTVSSGFGTRAAFLQFLQRALYVFLAAALFTNGMHIYSDNALPNRSDALVQIAFFLVSFISFLRHRTAPRIPNEIARPRWNKLSKELLRLHQ